MFQIKTHTGVSDQISGEALKPANVAGVLTCPLLALDQAKQLPRAEAEDLLERTIGITNTRAAEAFWGLWPDCGCIDAMHKKEGYGGGHPVPVVFRCHQVSDRDDLFNLRQLDSQPVLDPGRQQLDRVRAGTAGA